MFSAFLIVAACSNPSTLEGKVVDIWGEPIEGATVVMVGQGERPLTDAEGRYTLKRTAGAHKLKAGRDGYIQEHAELEVTAATEEGPLFRLYKKPSDPGFFLVTTGRYVKLEPTQVHTIGNELAQKRGIKSAGDATSEGTDLRVVFHTDLKLDEIMRLGLELHRLAYVREAEMPGPLSSTMVTVNLYTTAGEVPIDIAPMRSRTDYLITPKGAIEPGLYAFQSQALLDPDDNETFNQIPEELRVVFPLEHR